MSALLPCEQGDPVPLDLGRPRMVYAQLRRLGSCTLAYGMDPADQRALAAAVRRLATRDGLRFTQYRPRGSGRQPMAMRGHAVMHLYLVDAEGAIITPDRAT